MDLDDVSTQEASSQIPEESPSPVDDTQAIDLS